MLMCRLGAITRTLHTYLLISTLDRAGVLTMYNADYLELRREPKFEQGDISVLRNQIPYYFVRNCIAEHPKPA